MPKLAVVYLGLMVALGAGCQKQQLSVNGQNVSDSIAKMQGAAAPAPVPGAVAKQVALGLALAKTVLQTREPIHIDLTSADARPGAMLTLTDATSGKELMHEALPAAAGDEAVSFALEASPATGGDVRLTLYPLGPDLVGKLAYGENHLAVSLDGLPAAGPANGEGVVTIHDFPYFAVGTASFGAGVQSVSGFQGHVALMSGAALSNGTTVLTTGTVGVLND